MKITASLLETLEANARRASQFDRKAGDQWTRSHSYVLNGPHTICVPAYDKNTSLSGYPPSGHLFSSDTSRHIAGANPATVIALVQEIRDLRARLAL